MLSAYAYLINESAILLVTSTDSEDTLVNLGDKWLKKLDLDSSVQNNLQ